MLSPAVVSPLAAGHEALRQRLARRVAPVLRNRMVLEVRDDGLGAGQVRRRLADHGRVGREPRREVTLTREDGWTVSRATVAVPPGLG